MNTDGEVDYNKILKQAQDARLKIKQTVDSFTAEIEGTDTLPGLVTTMIECASYTDSWGVRDRLEGMKAALYKMEKSTSRNVAQSKESYRDGMRTSMGRTKNSGATAWQEREATYEIANITTYKILNQLEQTLADLDIFSRYLNGRLAWVKDRQFWLRTLEKNSRE